MTDDDPAMKIVRADASPSSTVLSCLIYDFVNQRLGARVEVVIKMKVNMIAPFTACFHDKLDVHFRLFKRRFQVGGGAYNGDTIPLYCLLEQRVVNTRVRISRGVEKWFLRKRWLYCPISVQQLV